jgi:hypothetical protein
MSEEKTEDENTRAARRRENYAGTYNLSRCREREFPRPRLGICYADVIRLAAL